MNTKLITKTYRASEIGLLNDKQFCPRTLVDAIIWLQARLEEVPAEYRSDAHISFDTDSEWGDYYATCEISYRRPETPEDIAERERQEAEQAERRRAKDLQLLAELQAKYQQPNT